jgi:hypothetical protein
VRALISTRPGVYLIVALVGAGVLGFVVIRLYGLESFLPGLVGGFGASLVAFVLALSWERDKERQQVKEERDRELKQLARREQTFNERRRAELQRRLSTVRTELERNFESLQSLKGLDADPGAPGFVHLHPQLLDGAWTANAPQLSELVDDYELIADLATTYDRIEELRWRLRYRTEHHDKELDPMTAPLVTELREEVRKLLIRVGSQIESPAVRSDAWQRFSQELSARLGL